MSEIYGLGIAMPMNYKAMVDKLKRFGSFMEPFKITIESPQNKFQVEILSDGKMNVSGDVECQDHDLMSQEEITTALIWAATALIGTLSMHGLQAVGMEAIEKGSHIENRRKGKESRSCR